MNNVLRFPMNAPMNILSMAQASNFLANGKNGSSNAGQSAGTYPVDDSLLATLSFVRECLHGGKDGLDARTQRLCLEAVESALSSAISLERTVLNQTLYIEDMARVACTDQLTGAYNRRGFEQEFHRTLAAATRYDETGVLVFVDLDGFKPINDTYGHAAGDQVLIEVTRTLQENIRPQDMVARIGGDEFTVLLTRTDWENGLARAEYLKHLLNTLYVRWNGKNIAVRASLGFQRYSASDDAELLLKKADTAMYEAKRLRSSSRGADV
jgi:diguanylate cyclase (GGDEF)-like protein